MTITGANSGHGIWLEFLDGQRGVLDHLPDPHQGLFDLSFGRDTPAITNVGYQLDVKQGRVGLSILSNPRSEVTVSDNLGPITVGFQFDGPAAGELQGLPAPGPGTPVSLAFEHQGRKLTLKNALLNRYAWQIYGTRADAPVRISNSVINELGAAEGGRFEVRASRFQFAILGAVGPASEVRVLGSDIESQSILGQSTGLMRIEESVIHGAVVQATGSSRILLVNNELKENIDNPFNGKGLPVRYITQDDGLIVVLGLKTLDAQTRGTGVAIVGDVAVKGKRAEGSPLSYELDYALAGSSEFTPISKGNGEVFGKTLGSLETAGLAPGNYVIRLRTALPGGAKIEVGRPLELK
jgi:hypothetical protein